MEYIVSAEEMRTYDTNTIEKFHVPAVVLMERAALGVVEVIFKVCGKNRKKVLIAAGTGNNGADGIAVGRLLMQEGFQVTFFLAGEKGRFSELMKLQVDIIESYGGKICTVFPEDEYDMIVDALFGIGLTRALEGSFKEVVRKINESKSWKVSVDMPSGIHTDTGEVMGEAVRADATVTFAYRKLGMVLYPGCEYAGEVYVKQIGITEESFERKMPKVFSYKEPVKSLLPKRRPDGNKGTFGKVLVIAGSKNMSGACLLSAEAALRTGCGMVRILTEKENKTILGEKLPEAILGLYETKEEMKEQLQKGCEWADCILAGPGCGINEDTEEKLKFVLKACEKPIVIDADGLNVISENLSLYNSLKTSIIEKKRTVILTPHLGEFSRLHGKSVSEIKKAFIAEAESYAMECGCVLVCKDVRTVVCKKGENVYLNMSGNCGMATAGSGDVLAGVITGLLAQKMEAFEAAVLGVYLHGKAGDMAAMEKNEYTLIAGDLIKQFDNLFRF
ncbi:MAG: NAD(P)H-hydrate dehydratase [Lachnospiraceae bacterium]|nr:NAD(P)H-hydrate dehydratase [Lachnospiraceae bacterium]